MRSYSYVTTFSGLVIHPEAILWGLDMRKKALSRDEKPARRAERRDLAVSNALLNSLLL
jgi:hypothetical protein